MFCVYYPVRSGTCRFFRLAVGFIKKLTIDVIQPIFLFSYQHKMDYRYEFERPCQFNTASALMGHARFRLNICCITLREDLALLPLFLEKYPKSKVCLLLVLDLLGNSPEYISVSTAGGTIAVPVCG